MAKSPPNPPKLHLNENLSPRLAAQLRKHGFDVVATQETGLLAEPDDVQLAHAASEQRAILTFNVNDFSNLHFQYQAEGREHWGIIFSTQEPIGILLRRLLSFLHTISVEELKNQIR